MKHWKSYFYLPFLLVLCWLPCEAKHMAVVVDRSNTLTNITSAELAKVFQSSTKKWPDGRNITVVVSELSSADLQQTLQRLLKMTPDEVKVFLAVHKASFVTVDSEEVLLKLLASTPGAVGLVDVYSITSKVNVLKVDGKLPLEQGYLLH